jgi:hypothetical protein
MTATTFRSAARTRLGDERATRPRGDGPADDAPSRFDAEGRSQLRWMVGGSLALSLFVVASMCLA